MSGLLPGGVFPLAVWPLTAIKTSCVKRSLLSLSCKVVPFTLAFKNTPFSTLPKSPLSLVLSAFDYGYYHKLLLLALSRQGAFHLQIVTLLLLEACFVIYHQRYVCACVFARTHAHVNAFSSVRMFFLKLVWALCDLSVLDHSQSFTDYPEIPHTPGILRRAAGLDLEDGQRWKPKKAEQEELGYN